MVTARQLQENRTRLGARIRTMRKSQGYSQEGFGHACGLDRTYIGGVERGEYNIALDNIYKIAAALKISIAQLFKE
jgi:transcriptional regulator with XRE-family HTH domain